MNSEVPTHRRSIVMESFDDPRGHRISATLKDERPWAESDAEVPVLHSMVLEVLVDPVSLTIIDARAEMKNFPHAECQSIEPAFRQLIGLSVMRGYNKAVQNVLGRERSCTHLEFLARAIGPMTIQVMASSHSRSGRNSVAESGSSTMSAWLVNSCHLWAEGGIGASKLALAWRPGTTEYPTPSLVELRRRARD